MNWCELTNWKKCIDIHGYYHGVNTDDRLNI